MSLITNLKFKRSENDLGWVANYIEEFYESQKRLGFIQKTNFSASTLTYGNGACPRYWWHAFHGAEFEDVNDPHNMAVMFYGTTSHERVQAIFGEHPDLTEIEQEIDTRKDGGVPFRGFIDLMFDRDGKKVVGEYKTSRKEAFVHRQAKMAPTDGHLLQVLLYMHYTNADYGFVLYENKNDQSLISIPVEWTPKNKERVQLCLDWMEEVWSAYEAKTMPKREFKKNSSVCNSCPVQATCWSDAEGELEIGRLPTISQ